MASSEQQSADQQLALAMAYSNAYSKNTDYNKAEDDSRHQREGSRDSDREDSDSRRRGGNFERNDLKRDRESTSRRYTPYDTNRRSRSSGAPEKKVFVSNIPFESRWQNLKDHMNKVVGDVAFAEIFEDEKGRSKGCGVVEFTSSESAERCISLCNGQDFNGRNLLVRHTRPEDENRMHRSRLRGNSASQSVGGTGGGLPSLLNLSTNPMMKKSNDPAASTVFVTNLDYKVNWQKLKDTFKCAGHVIRAEIMEDDEKKSKGMGTVQFETPMEAMNAVNLLHGKMLMDRALRVRMDRAAPPVQNQMSNLATNAQQLLGGAGANNPLAAAAANNPMALLQLLQSLQGLTALAQLTGLGGVANLGNTQPQTNSSSNQNMGMGASQSMGTSNALPDMSSLANLGALGNLGNLGNFSNMQSPMQSTMQSMAGQYGSQYSTGQYGTSTSYGTSTPQYGTTTSSSAGSSMNQGDASGKQVFVRNLPWKYTWQDLKDKFRPAGKVMRADILTEPSGRSKGCGIVVFETQEEAQMAISAFNGASFDGREIDVRLDRFG
ncbi:predicted protein [Nematostella vectensis]|uniref:RRM domain-containing protein n=1 Tax=Nematostella vectensis TaxID=45351 RepID=A7RSW7_NEMVE|nr:predicted protein [Nematostella vectensis]|eukprot:XP_001637595.1 predicted protein [Nematostella vectensis]